MKKLVLIFLILGAGFTSYAQKRFELDVNTKFGYYFPGNETGLTDDYFPDNALSPAVGFSFGYTFLKNTGVFLGLEYSFLSPKMNDYFGKELDVTWQSLNVPFNIQQGVGQHFFLTGGVTLIQQLKGHTKGVFTMGEQKVPEFNWQAGAGYKWNELKISLQYYRGFQNINKSTKVSQNEWYNVNVRHQEVFVKLEYPLWKF